MIDDELLRVAKQLHLMFWYKYPFILNLDNDDLLRFAKQVL